MLRTRVEYWYGDSTVGVAEPCHASTERFGAGGAAIADTDPKTTIADIKERAKMLRETKFFINFLL